jgi:thiamine biosynthesis lipoprotein
MPRRRVLTLLATSVAIAGLPDVLAAAAEATLEWRGTALGGRVRMLFASDDSAAVQRIVEQAIAEIDRLENIFSLYRPESELCRLNRSGSLSGPSIDLVDLLSESIRFGELSGGAFDVTVQTLWNLYREHFSQVRRNPGGPQPAAIAAALALVDYRLIDVSPARIDLAKPGMAVTLNGIAQGYITDRIADLLRHSGFEHVLVDLGEIRATGHPPSAAGWPVRIEFMQRSAERPEPLLLSGRAIATSAGAASEFDASGLHHHIFDPATGTSSCRFQGVSVIAGRATLADGLSTALSILPVDRGIALLDRIGDVEAYWLTESGALLRHAKPA